MTRRGPVPPELQPAAAAWLALCDATGDFAAASTAGAVCLRLALVRPDVAADIRDLLTWGETSAADAAAAAKIAALYDRVATAPEPDRG